MSDEKSTAGNETNSLAPDENDTAKEGAVLKRKPRTLEELTESSDQSLKTVTEHLDQIEAEINATASKKNSD